VLAWRLFSRPHELDRTADIIIWWELRRLPYNLVVGATGLVTGCITLLVAAMASWKFDEPLGLPDPPIFAVFAVFAYGIMANVCFTGGWMAEIIVRRAWGARAGAFGEITFFLGMLFSIILTLVPAMIFTALLVLRLLLH